MLWCGEAPPGGYRARYSQLTMRHLAARLPPVPRRYPGDGHVTELVKPSVLCVGGWLVEWRWGFTSWQHLRS